MKLPVSVFGVTGPVSVPDRGVSSVDSEALELALGLILGGLELSVLAVVSISLSFTFGLSFSEGSSVGCEKNERLFPNIDLRREAMITK